MNIFMHNIINKMKRSEQVDDKFDIIKSFERSRHLISSRNAIISDHFQPRKLNKKKKHLLQERRNTEIDRQNRMLYEKIAKYGKKPKPSSFNHSRAKHKFATQPHSPQNSRLKKKGQKSAAKTLFMGHNFIDGVQFKIKIVIVNETYCLIGKNEHTDIILQMGEKDYWQLHNGQLHENPCNIFQYLKIEKGRIDFRVQESEKKKRKKNLIKLPKI